MLRCCNAEAADLMRPFFASVFGLHYPTVGDILMLTHSMIVSHGMRRGCRAEAADAQERHADAAVGGRPGAALLLLGGGH